MTRKQFTVHQTEENNFFLENIENPNDTVLVNKDHAKYDWVSNNQGRIVNITDAGR